MKSQLIVKYQQVLLRNKTNNSGFTLVELMVVIMIIGILSAISTNSLLNYIPKAKQAEAKTSIASINSAQSAYWLTHSTFANNMNALSIGLPTSTPNYTYTIAGNANIGTVNATTTNTTLKGYAGAVEEYSNTNNENEIASVICEAALAGNNIVAVPTSAQPGTGACGTDIEL